MVLVRYCDRCLTIENKRNRYRSLPCKCVFQTKGLPLTSSKRPLIKKCKRCEVLEHLAKLPKCMNLFCGPDPDLSGSTFALFQ